LSDWSSDVCSSDLGNGDRGGNRKPGAQANVDGHGAEQQPEECSKDYRSGGEFPWTFFGRHIAAEFTWWRRGTPCLFARPRLFGQMNPPYLPQLDADAAPVRGIMPQVGQAGKRILAAGG